MRQACHTIRRRGGAKRKVYPVKDKTAATETELPLRPTGWDLSELAPEHGETGLEVEGRLDSLENTVDPSGLSPDTYTATVSVDSPGGNPSCFWPASQMASS